MPTPAVRDVEQRLRLEEEVAKLMDQWKGEIKETSEKLGDFAFTLEIYLTAAHRLIARTQKYLAEKGIALVIADHTDGEQSRESN